MDKNFYIQKIERLSDDKLKELLQLRNDGNLEIITLAENEAVKRGIDPRTVDVAERKSKSLEARSKKDEGVNWMSFLADFLSGL